MTWSVADVLSTWIENDVKSFRGMDHAQNGSMWADGLTGWIAETEVLHQADEKDEQFHFG